ncbi:MAG: VOC family protein [Pseudomonadota bacterium]
MAKVLGVGGIFFLCKDVDATRAWYTRVLGIEINDFGGHAFSHSEAANAFGKGAMTIWSPFQAKSDYFKPSTSDWMMNLMVDDLDAMVERVRSEDVPLEGEPVTESYGKFAWIMDPDGRKIELWEPTDAVES